MPTAILTTIVPIFAVIGLGVVARWKGAMPDAFLMPANRLVYYLAIPAMIFRSIAGVDLTGRFDPTVLGLTVLSVLLVAGVAWAAGRAMAMGRQRTGTFIQSAIHGNLGYIGLAVAFYFMGREGFVRAGILAGFLMIFQNFCAVVALQVHAGDGRGRLRHLVAAIMGNPVIVSAMAGIAMSLAKLPIPTVVDRCLQILGDLALPMALLIIGASLQFRNLNRGLLAVAIAAGLKLVVLPGTALWLFTLSGAAYEDVLPALVLLAAPTATVAYVMARELRGDADFAVSAISVSTLLSAPSYAVWLHLAAPPSFY